MAAAARRSGPVLIAYDGTAAADHAIREAGVLLEGRPALVVSVWKEGIGFELVENPAAVGIPPTPVSVRTAIEIDEAIRERTERTAQRGAGIAAEAGFAQPDGLAVADELDVPVAETIADVARKHDAQAIVVGAHGQGRVSEVVLGSVSRDVVRRATCPVVVVREAPAT